MPIREHPVIGTILTCDFDQGFRAPEMVKRRPVVVISPKIRQRAGLCTVVALSTSAPDPVMPYHCEITIDPPLPPPWDNPTCWVKGDIVCSVGFHRLDFPRYGKGLDGKRVYRYEPISAEQLIAVRRCVLSGLGLAQLTKHIG